MKVLDFCPVCGGYDRLAIARRAGNSRRTHVTLLDETQLGRMEEDCPFLPRLFQRLCRLRRQVVGDVQHAVLVGSPDIHYPFYRHTVTQQLIIWDEGEKLRLWRSSMFGFNVFWDSDLLDNFPKLHQLGGAGGWMGLQISAFHPLIGFIVVAGVAQRCRRPFWCCEPRQGRGAAAD